MQISRRGQDSSEIRYQGRPETRSKHPFFFTPLSFLCGAGLCVPPVLCIPWIVCRTRVRSSSISTVSCAAVMYWWVTTLREQNRHMVAWPRLPPVVVKVGLLVSPEDGIFHYRRSSLPCLPFSRNYELRIGFLAVSATLFLSGIPVYLSGIPACHAHLVLTSGAKCFYRRPRL